MIQWLKKHFIPHDGNNHRPHFLRSENTRILFVAVLLFELVAFILPTINFVAIVNNTGLATVLPGVLGSLTNSERQSNNLPQLRENPVLNEAARLKAEDMALKGYFAHVNPEGKTPWHWLEAVGYKYDYAGENLAINFSDSEDVTRAWMNSPTHRANIVKVAYTEIGTGIATGVYQGRETIFVAQVYANPRPSTAPVEGVVIEELTDELTVSPVEGELEPVRVLGATSEEPGIWDTLMASPKSSTNMVLATILGVAILALLLKVIIKIHIQHVGLIVNGLLLVVIIAGVFLTNNYMSSRNLQIETSIDYSTNGEAV